LLLPDAGYRGKMKQPPAISWVTARNPDGEGHPGIFFPDASFRVTGRFSRTAFSLIRRIAKELTLLSQAARLPSHDGVHRRFFRKTTDAPSMRWPLIRQMF
jgi:hypothetical protein